MTQLNDVINLIQKHDVIKIIRDDDVIQKRDVATL